MALYIVEVPDPAPGADWKTAVPGEYLYNVTGVTATLLTTTSSPVLRDSSGNGNDGTYVPIASATNFVPGALDGDAGAQLDLFPLNVRVLGLDLPAAAFPFDASFSLVWWLNRNASPIYHYIDLSARDGGGNPVFAVGVTADGRIEVFCPSTGLDALTGPVVPFDDTWHMIGISYDAGTQHATCYLDGAVQANVLNTDAPPLAVPPVTVTWGITPPNIPDSDGAIDELAYIPSAITALDMTNIFGLAPIFDVYTLFVLSYLPTAYYHLDDVDVRGTGRQVGLNITDGTTRVALVPSGFAEVATPGPYLYSWVPRLGNAAETPDGHTITVPTPPLVLPAGYTIGTSTLDLGLNDQWSDIRVWWDSNIMDAQSAQSAYLFPPSVHLVYHQEP